MIPTISLVGRPNVGKSSLFNRISKSRKAVVSAIPGTTRDRICETVNIAAKKAFLLVDTGGLSFDDESKIDTLIKDQVEEAIDQTDLVLFVLDISKELTELDYKVADQLRKTNKEIIWIANKCDNRELEDKADELYKLGAEHILKTSALHNKNINFILEKIDKVMKLPKITSEYEEEMAKEKTNIAFLGRPNVGKSSLLNSITNTKRVIVSSMPGTTRDSIDINFSIDDNHYVLVDTAGIRRRGKRGKGIEKYSVIRSFKSIYMSDVCILLIDAEEGLTSQDLHILSYIQQEHKGLIIAVNKIDLFDDREALMNEYIHKLSIKCDFVPWAPIVFISAKKRINITKVLEIANEIKKEREKEIRTPELNKFVRECIKEHKPSGTKNKPPKIYYVTQSGTNPPRFNIYMNRKERMHFSYPRYLENKFRERFGFIGTAIYFKWHEKEKRVIKKKVNPKIINRRKIQKKRKFKKSQK